MDGALGLLQIYPKSKTDTETLIFVCRKVYGTYGTFFCSMDFRDFPFDSQMCPLMIESFAYTIDKLFWNWSDIPVEKNPSLRSVTSPLCPQTV